MTIKTFNKDGVEIKVGDKVVVTDTGLTYTTYDKWAERNNFKGWENFSECTVGQVGVIEVIAEHGTGNDILYGVNINGKKVIIGYKGVEFVSKSQPFQLKANQRVVLRNGKKAVVIESKGVFYIGYFNAEGKQAGFDRAHFEKDGKKAYFGIVEIYDQPDAWEMLNPFKRGSLIYKDDEFIRAQIAEAQVEVEKAEEVLAAATAKLEKLTKA